MNKRNNSYILIETVDKESSRSLNRSFTEGSKFSFDYHSRQKLMDAFKPKGKQYNRQSSQGSTLNFHGNFSYSVSKRQFLQCS